MQTESRFVFFGRIRWLAARTGLVGMQALPLNLHEFHPLGRFSASFHVRCGDHFVMNKGEGYTASATTPFDQL